MGILGWLGGAVVMGERAERSRGRDEDGGVDLVSTGRVVVWMVAAVATLAARGRSR